MFFFQSIKVLLQSSDSTRTITVFVNHSNKYNSRTNTQHTIQPNTIAIQLCNREGINFPSTAQAWANQSEIWTPNAGCENFGGLSVSAADGPIRLKLGDYRELPKNINVPLFAPVDSFMIDCYTSMVTQWFKCQRYSYRWIKKKWL